MAASSYGPGGVPGQHLRFIWNKQWGPPKMNRREQELLDKINLAQRGVRDPDVLRTMTLKELSKSEPIPFSCPMCEAEYKIVMIEACDLQRGKISCLRCGFPHAIRFSRPNEPIDHHSLRRASFLERMSGASFAQSHVLEGIHDSRCAVFEAIIVELVLIPFNCVGFDDRVVVFAVVIPAKPQHDIP